jgi:hypothetical protein
VTNWDAVVVQGVNSWQTNRVISMSQRSQIPNEISFSLDIVMNGTLADALQSIGAFIPPRLI